MPLYGPTLATAIRTKAESRNPVFAANIGDDMNWLSEAVAEAVVEHIQANVQGTVRP